jgi:hypothetical protein
MATKNSITGDEIKSKVLSKEGRDNWDRAFAKKTAIEWAGIDEIVILESNGFKNDDGITLETPISYAEYSKRIPLATVETKKNIN